MTVTTELPGIYFDVRLQAAPEALPRMDVAGFVGFAERGPLNLPVAVEDIGRFRELFGGPVRLAWNAADGRWETGHLHAEMEAFFLNGGQRCWVVRVAGSGITTENEIPVPGLRTAAGQAATCRARAPGTWARALHVETALRRERLDATDASAETAAGLRLTVAAPAAPLAAGDLLELEYAAESLVVFLAVTAVGTANPTSPEPHILVGRVFAEGKVFAFERTAGSPPAADDGELSATSPGRALPVRAPDRVHRLTFDLLTHGVSGAAGRVVGLGFVRDHPRFWAQLPDDATLFQRRDGARLPPADPALDALHQDVRVPRLDVAGPAKSTEVYLPVGMRAFGAPPPAAVDTLVDAAALEAARLRDNGLEGFSDALFLDPDLAEKTAASLLTSFDDKAYRRGDAVTGLHALLGIEEVAALAVPDAVHVGWTRGVPEHPALDAPRLSAANAADRYGRLRLSWPAVADAGRYRLEVAASADFADARVIADRALGRADGAAPGTVTVFFEIPDICSEIHYFRVRAENDVLIGPWSNEVRRALPPANAARAFEPCGGFDPEQELTLRVEPGSPDPTLRWGATDGTPLPVTNPPLNFELQTAADPQFLHGDSVSLVATESTPSPVADRLRYFRVRALPAAGEPGPWSNPVVLQPTELGAWVTRDPATYDPEPLLAVHHALIRVCAARCDAVAMLGLPRHYRTDDALSHLSALRPSGADRRALGTSLVPPLTAQESGESAASVYTYAVLAHPWVRYRDPSAPARTAIAPRPPDGFLAGVYAGRTRTGGAWLAPANVPLVGALGLDPELTRDDVARLAGARITALHRDPRGVLWTGADTLSPARLIGLVNVRRLFIVLRRLVLREGRRFVFEPHSDDFRGLVRSHLTHVLMDMYQRGAFRGQSPEQAFQLVIEDVNNPPQAVDLGRFVVDMAVAPAAPLQFLRLRLVQREPERLTVEEVA